jgi:hypothetical protein
MAATMRSRDTSEKVARIQDEVQERLGPEGRLALALEMSALARAFAIAGLREERPGLSDAELTREYAKRLLDRTKHG